MHYKFLRLSDEIDFNVEEYPEKRLMAAVMIQAIEDARLQLTAKEMKLPTTDRAEVVKDAIDFLFSDRSDIFCSILDIEPDAFRESFLKTQKHRCHDQKMISVFRERENRKRFNFQVNYELFRPSSSPSLY